MNPGTTPAKSTAATGSGPSDKDSRVTDNHLRCREIPLVLDRNTRTMPVFRDYSQTNRTPENGLLGIECGVVLDFLQEAHAQSGFTEGIRRMQRDDKPGLGHGELTSQNSGAQAHLCQHRCCSPQSRAVIHHVKSAKLSRAALV